MENQCPICKTILLRREPLTGGIYLISCPQCGKFKVTEEFDHFAPRMELEDKLSIIQGILRDRHEKQIKTLLTNGDISDKYPDAFTIKDLLSSTKIPQTPDEKALNLLNHLKRLTGDTFGKRVQINVNDDFSLAYAKNATELGNYIHLLEKLGYIESVTTGISLVLGIEGWRRVTMDHDEESTQCFVAMWFSGYKSDRDPDKYSEVTKKDRDNCFKAIIKAFSDLPYTPIRVDDIEHNEKICDQIVVEIKKSKFLIADVTGNRGGVYFEAGFAKASKKEVIWLCKKGYENDMHFDTDHYNHILYEDYEDLSVKLKMRILATIY